MAVTRRLLAASGAGSFVLDPVAVIRSIVADVTKSDAHAYGLLEPGTLGNEGMAGLKVLDDGAGGYVGVYHVYEGSGTHFDIRVATSPDLLTWTYQATLATHANLPKFGRRADGSFIVIWADEDASGGWRLRLRRYTTRANLLSGTYADNVLLARTLATGGGPEQAPNFYAIEDPMSIGFVYNDNDPAHDKRGAGTLTGWSGTGYTSWVAAAQTALNAAVIALGAFAVTDSEVVDYLGHRLEFVQGQVLTMPGPYGAFHPYYWDGSTAVAQSVTTHGGSTELQSLAPSIVDSPVHAGKKVLAVTCFFHATGAAPGEYGEAIWYRELPE